MSRDLPMPGSPEISTTRPSPLFACSQRRSSSSISSSRPTSGVAPERNASKRLSIPLSPMTRHADCGSAKPASACGPRSARSNSPPTCRRVASAMTSVFGAASACSRAARFGVSPTTPRSCAAPCADQVADHGKPGGDADPRLAGHAALCNRADRLDHRQPGAHRPLGIVLMRLRIAEIDQHPVAHVLGDKAVEAADRIGHGAVVGPDQLAQILRVKTRRQRRRADEVAEHHRQLPAFGVDWRR